VSSTEVRYKIRDAARLLDRSPHTLRSWEKKAEFPKELYPFRDEKNERYYTPALIEKIRVWIANSNFRPGSGISNYNPTAEDRERHLASLRAAAAKRGPMRSIVSGTEGNVLSFLSLIGGEATVHQLAGQLGIRPGVMQGMVEQLARDEHVTVDTEGLVRLVSE
jgi:transposase-like protein